MREHSTIDDVELHAFIDGELDKERAAEIAAMLESDAGLAALAAAYRLDMVKLAELHRPLISQPLPERWIQMIQDDAKLDRAGLDRAPQNRGGVRPVRLRWLSSESLWARRSVLALAASVLLMVGFWLAHDRLLRGGDADAIVAEALAAQDNAMVPELVVAADAMPAPDERDRVLATALGQKLKAPDLTKMGYRLTSIRVYSGVAGGKAAELSYTDAQNRGFTLYLRHPSGPPRFDLTLRGNTRICIWQDDILSTVMLGEMSAGEMLRLASLAYAGLNA